MKNIVVAGGTGLIGNSLTSHLLSTGNRIVVLTRKKNTEAQNGIEYSYWNPQTGQIDNEVISQANYIINLSGENVAAKRWSSKRKAEILQSRVSGNDLLVNTLKANKNNCSCFISASAIGWYGPDTKETKQHGFIEVSDHYHDFLGDTCKLWEDSAHAAEALGIRTVILRTGIVLSKKGGALEEFRKPLRYGVAAIIGSGQQTISWIHIDDLCRMYVHAMQNNSVSGIFNAVAPGPVSNEELTLALAKQIRGKNFITMNVPSFILKIMLGEMSIEVLKSTTVNADKIKNAGFQFLYPGIQAAIQNLFKD